MLRFVNRVKNHENLIKIEGMPQWLSNILYARGIRTKEEAEKFLYPSYNQLRSPTELPGTWETVKLLRELAKDHTKIAVYGDYDVDGVCGATILQEALTKAGLRPFVYIPDRHEEGYGLNTEAIEKLSGQCKALITVDCGITSVKEVELAKKLGMTVLVTDHHHPSDELPKAHTLVNPQVGGYPFPYLCGAGVAWKISSLLNGREFADDQLDVCALATIADLVPLTDENRVLVSLGLEKLNHTKRSGIQALCYTAGLEQKKITSEKVAFQLAPRLNAAGRLESAMASYELLTCKEPARAHELAIELEKINKDRRNAEKQVVEESEKIVRNMDLTSLYAIVVEGENWDSGVVGLSAGKIAEKYSYPTVVLTRSQDGKTCVGSARSACGVDLYTALKNCGDIFLRFGGHSQAAGMTLLTENVPLLQERLSEQVKIQLKGEVPVKEIEYDGVMTLSQMTEEIIEKISLLEPFGMGNYAPCFLLENVEGVVMRQVGADGAHLKCTFRQDGAIRDGIFFGGGRGANNPSGIRYSVLGVPDVNVFMGRESVQCQVKAMKMNPETLPGDEDQELRIFLQDLTHWTENIQSSEPVFSLEKGRKEIREEEDVPAQWMEQKQGTLLWCRKAETARKMAARFKNAAFISGDARDPRSYTAVGVYLTQVGERYKRIVLCDGIACEEEKNDLLLRFPDADFVSLKGQKGAFEILKSIRMDVTELRELYRLLRQKQVTRLDDLSEKIGLPLSKVMLGGMVLEEMKLVKCHVSPPDACLLPPQKCSAEDSRLYRILWNANLKEGG